MVYGWRAESYGELGCVVAWVQRLGKVSAAVRQGSMSLAASTEQGGISGKMDWRDRTYYWVRLNLSDIARFKSGHDGYGKNYERRVKELKKIPGLKMHPLPSMALARWKREAIPEWAQMLVSCRKAHLSTLMNTFMRFGLESYGYFAWERVAEPKKGEKRKMKAEEKIEAGDLVRVLDGSGIKDYCGGWSARMKEYVGRTLEVERVINDLFTGDGVKLYWGGGYTWDTRGLELVEKGKAQPEAETKAEKAKGEETMKKAIKEIMVRNSAGILKITAERELNLRDVFSGIGDDKLPPMPNPRLEIHQGPYGEVLVTLTDRTVDNTMFLAEIEDGMPPHIYVGHYEPEKRSEDYVTFEPWREK